MNRNSTRTLEVPIQVPHDEGVSMFKNHFHRLSLAILAFAVCSCTSTKKQEADRRIETAPPTVATPPAKTEATKPSQRFDLVTCTKEGEVRAVEIEPIDPKGCKLQYLKWGKRNEIASSRHGKAHCESIRDRIRKNLTDAKFSCSP